MRIRWFAVTPDIDVGLHNPPGSINVVAIDAGAMILIFTDNLKATNRSAVSFSTAGYPGGGSSVLSPVEIGLLLPQAYDDRWPARMPLRQVRGDQVADGAAATQGYEGCNEHTKL
jgi:hypothetical protein